MRRMGLHVCDIEELFDDLRKIGFGVLQNALQAFHGALRLRRHATGNNRAVGLTPRHASSEQNPARAHAHPGHVPPAFLHRVIGENVATVHKWPSFQRGMVVAHNMAIPSPVAFCLQDVPEHVILV